MQFFICRWCNTVLSRNMQSQVHSVNSRFMRFQRLTLRWITVKHGGFKKICSLLLWNSVRAFCSHRVPFRSHRKCTNPQNLAAMDWQSMAHWARYDFRWRCSPISVQRIIFFLYWDLKQAPPEIGTGSVPHSSATVCIRWHSKCRDEYSTPEAILEMREKK